MLPEIAAKKITFSAITDDADFTLRGATIHYRGVPIINQLETKLRGIPQRREPDGCVWHGACARHRLRPHDGGGDRKLPRARHRCEFVRDLDGVRWSETIPKATNLDSVEKAILSQDRPLVLIAGGKDKGFEFDPIAPLIRERVKAAVLIGEMKDRIAKSWSRSKPQRPPVSKAVGIAQSPRDGGRTVLFSPGASSFGMFRNYGERWKPLQDGGERAHREFREFPEPDRRGQRPGEAH